MFRLNLPSLRFSAPILHSAIARSGATVGWSFASTGSTPFWTRHPLMGLVVNDDSSIKNNDSCVTLREIQETAKLVDVAGRTFLSSSSAPASSSSSSSPSSSPFFDSPTSHENVTSKKGSSSRFLFRKYQVCDLLAPSHSTPTATSMLFTSKRCCCNPSASVASHFVATDADKTTAPRSCETAVNEFYFNLPVIQHVLSTVSKDKTLRAVFEATDGELAGTSAPQINEKNIASRYDTIAHKLKNEQIAGAVLSNKEEILLAVTQALPTFKLVVSKVSGEIRQCEYPLLLGTIFLLCSFASHEPRITAESMSSQLLPGLTPYRRLRNLGAAAAANVMWSKLDSTIEHLITSTFEQAQKIDNAGKERLPEIIRSIIQVHGNLSTGNGLPEKCEFTAASHTKFSCSTDGKDHISRRFVSPCAGSGITKCFACQWTPKTKKHDRELFDNDIVNIVSGSSGSGKTISSLICGATADQPVHCMLVHTGLDCGPADIDPALDTEERNNEALERLRSGILITIMDEKQQAALPAFDPSLWWISSIKKSSNQSSTQATITSWFAPAPGEWKGVLRIVIDEIGTHPVFLRALCAVWNSARKNIAKSLGVSEEQLQLVAVGTGADNFELSKLGSIKDSYKVLTVTRDDELFKQLFQQQINKMNEQSLRPPALHLYKLLFCENPALDDGAPDTTSLPSPTSDPVFRCLLRLVTNARCAAIILSLMYQAFVTNKKGKLLPRAEWSLVQLRASASYWCVEAVDVYCSKNGLAGMNAEQRHFSLGQAIAYDLNRSLVVKGNTESERVAEWERYGVYFGLLSDTAREGKPHDEKNVIVYEQKSWTTANGRPSTKHFVIPCGTSRFVVDDAFVMMFLLLSDTVSNGVFARSYSNVHLLFEEAMFDYQRIAAQFGHRHPVLPCGDGKPAALTTAPATKSASLGAKVPVTEITLSAAAKAPPSTVAVTHDADGFTPPHLLYGLGCNTVYSTRLNFKLENAAFTKTTKKPKTQLPEVIQQSARMWREKVQRQGDNNEKGDAIVLLNGDNASCADVITLARNRIIFTQCKNGASVNAADINSEICKMRHKELLGLLCWCVDTTSAQEPVEIFYVLAGGDKTALRVEKFEKSTQEDDDESLAENDYFRSRCDIFNNTNDNQQEWPMMPPDSKSASCLSKLDTKVFGKDVNYRLHESIHFTYAYSLTDGSFPYSPVLKSTMPVPDKVADGHYSCMTREELPNHKASLPCGRTVSRIEAAPKIDAKKQ